jgi:thioredoxin 1
LPGKGEKRAVGIIRRVEERERKRNLPIKAIIYIFPYIPATAGMPKEKKMAEHLTVETFKEKVFDYSVDKEWKYKGELPGIIDFYADWCGPCKMVAPIIDQLSDEYEGKLNVWKVDTEAQQELAGAFGIQSIPSILFIPTEGQPQMASGALPKATFEKIIKEELGVS